MKTTKILLSLAFSLLAGTFASCEPSPAPKIKKDLTVDEKKHELLTIGGGCYWCIEAVFQQLEGVISAKSGFMGGTVKDPTYEQVIAGGTGHIEVVQIAFDPKKTNAETLLKWFWKAHDPTNPNGQGADIGERYTSHIFAHSKEQKEAAEKSKKEAQKGFTKPIATKIKDAGKFYVAKESHQDYYQLNKNKNPYCPAVITPKLKKLGLEH